MGQLEFCFEKRGGKRKGAGRKSTSETPRRRHEKRAKMSRSNPLLITLRLIAGLPSLRRGAAFRVVEEVLAAARDLHGMRIVHFDILGNHMHLIVEAESREAVARAMNGLQVRLIKQLNKLWGRRGTIFVDRYHDEVITSPRQMRNALRYTLNNAKHHGIALPRSIDPCSSGVAFDGWATPSIPVRALPTVVPPRTWLLTTGWKRHGLIGLDELPRTLRAAPISSRQ